MGHIRIDHAITKRPTAGFHNGGGTAVVFGETSYSYAELDRRATALATRLRQLGVMRGDRILVLMYNRIEWFDVFFAAAKMHAVLVPGNYLSVASELEYLVDDADARFILAEPALADRLSFLLDRPAMTGRLLLTDGDLDGWSPLNTDSAVDELDDFPDGAGPDEPFLLQYTSGTTGLPKAAIHTQTTILFNALGQMADFGLLETDTYLGLSALCWTAGFHAFTLGVLLAGGRVVIHHSRGIVADEVCEVAARHGVTISALVPTIMRRLLETPGFTTERMSSFRLIVTGTEPVPEELITAMNAVLPRCAVVQAFGMTEILGSGIILRPEDAIERLGSVGKSSALTQVRVESPEHHDLADGSVGELVIRSAATAVGYWNRPAESAAAFADGWFHTGDLARIDEAGFIFVVGRTKDMIISGGLNIYPAEVERVLYQHPSVEEVTVVGIPDPLWGEAPVAVVVPRAEIDPEDLRAFAVERLSKYKVPRNWIFTDVPLPKTVSGKVRKFEVRAEVLQRSTVLEIARSSDHRRD